jgi:hypothetical protein
MPSPFPGIDPYLERHWGDVHADLVALTRTSLNLVLPGDLVARMEERVVIDDVNPERRRAIYPDVRVYEDASQGNTTVTSTGGAAVAEPIVLEMEVEEHTETFVTILDPEGGQLVTVIEFLSPANKLAGEGRNQFRRKRDELLASQVNFVELDLIRQGSWRDLLAPVVAPASIRTSHRVITRRFHQVRQIELYPLSLRQPLPAIPIPLRQGDKDVRLELQTMVDQAYRNGRYDRIDYGAECHPPLEAEDAAWADELLRKAGLRK